jgi:cytochrome c
MKYFIISVLTSSFLAGAAWAGGDATSGEQVFKKCSMCHSAVDATNKIGPSLFGVVGRKAASVGGFAYSDGMKGFGANGAVWDEKTLDSYLADPRAFVPGNKMGFVGLKDQTARDNIIAYLKTKM